MNRAERRAAAPPKRRYLMTNLVFGQPHTNLFLNNQLKSLLDPTNIPALRANYDCEYLILSDLESTQEITKHPNFLALGQICDVNIMNLEWPADFDRVGSRYSLLQQLCEESVKQALTKGVNALSVWVADLVFAKSALPRMLRFLEQGYDGVLMVPIRAAADAANAAFQQIPYAATDLELFEIAYRNLHHLWVAADWHANMFSRMPYSMVWNSRSGLLAHNFGITPIVFKPNEQMLAVRGGIDSDLPGWLSNPHWCTDWTDAPVAGLEPLSNWHYPPFGNFTASTEGVAQWALHAAQGKPAVHPCQVSNLPHPLYYPTKQTFGNEALAAEAAALMADLHERVKHVTVPE